MNHFLAAERALYPFFENEMLSRIVSQQSSGKEATVFCCETGPALDAGQLLAAKIYRPPERRAFKQQIHYAEGRYVKGRTAQQAIKTRNPIGRQMLFEKWVAFEYQVLGRMFREGIPVPKPVAFGGYSILMEYLGDEEVPAPHLRNAPLAKAACEAVFAELLGIIEHMLSINLIHGDLSPYNILLWQERPYLIDVPQALDPRAHPDARELLFRDVQRVCEWANLNGCTVDGYAIAGDLWERWWQGEL